MVATERKEGTMTLSRKVEMGLVVASTTAYSNGRGIAWYVSQTAARPGSKRAKRDGVDWGYETDRSKAIPLTPYWARRFAADRRFCGDDFHFDSV